MLKKSLFTVGLLAAFGAAQAITFDIPVSLANVNSVDRLDDPDNFYASFNMDAVVGQNLSNYRIIGIGYSVELEALGTSWLSEMALLTESTSGLDGVVVRPGVGQNFPGVGAYSSGGIIDLVGLGLDVTLDADDMLNVQFYETFDDVAGQTDGVWRSGTVTYRFEAVPEPATMTALALGAAALIRRRRAAK